MIQNRDLQILEQVKSELIKTFKNEIKHVILFGSRAEGKANKYSDFDILVILNTNNYDWETRYQIMEIVYNIELENDVIIDIHVLSDFELKNTSRGKQPIFNYAIKNGVWE